MSIQTNDMTPGGVIARVFARNRLLLALTIVHFAIAYILCLILAKPFSPQTFPLIKLFVQELIPVFIIFLWFWRFGWLMLIHRPLKPAAWFINDIRGFITDYERILSGIFAMLLISVFASTFVVIKDLIPVMNMFSWDPLFAQIDRTLHGGTDPYILLMPILGTPYVTTFINVAYHMWFIIFYFIVFMACFDRINTVRRNSLLLSFVLIWAINGNLLATIFSSAGPVYYQFFGFGDHFLPLLDTLKEFSEISPIWVLDVHELLLDGYINDGPIKGISAMPSLHVAIAVLLAIYGFQCSRWLGWLLTAFAIVIQLGSVHLAWHYAIDGYVGAVVAVCCWVASAKLAARYR